MSTSGGLVNEASSRLQSLYMFPARGSFLLVISSREELRWILSKQRIALGPSRYKAPDALLQDDKLVCAPPRKCLRNRTRDRGRVIGTATITSPTADPPMGGYIRGPDIRSGM